MADSSQTMAAGGVGTAFSIVIFLIVKFAVPFFTAANHRRVRSVCCGQACVSSLDIEATTPVVVVAETGVGKSGVGGDGVGNTGLHVNPIHTNQPVS